MRDFFNRHRKTLFSAAGVAAGLAIAGARGDVLKLTIGALLGSYTALILDSAARKSAGNGSPEPVVSEPTKSEELNQT